MNTCTPNGAPYLNSTWADSLNKILSPAGAASCEAKIYDKHFYQFGHTLSDKTAQQSVT